MNHRSYILVLLFVAGGSHPVYADDEDGAPSTVTMECTYSDYGTSYFERASVAEMQPGGGGDAASIMTFVRDKEKQKKTFALKPGEVAECIYPSGSRWTESSSQRCSESSCAPCSHGSACGVVRQASWTANPGP